MALYLHFSPGIAIAKADKGFQVAKRAASFSGPAILDPSPSAFSVLSSSPDLPDHFPSCLLRCLLLSPQIMRLSGFPTLSYGLLTPSLSPGHGAVLCSTLCRGTLVPAAATWMPSGVPRCNMSQIELFFVFPLPWYLGSHLKLPACTKVGPLGTILSSPFLYPSVTTLGTF